MNLTVTSNGRQFDRLAIMYIGDIEVFRTSTAEPTKSGIIWNYVKEMQTYNALWKEPQTIIYDEGNLVDSTYTGLFNTTLTATFFTVPESPATADVILPITARNGAAGKSSVFRLPDQNATVAYTLPQNVNRAVVSLSATGQINEEFWYSNVPTSEVSTFANTTGPLIGGGTFREVQLYIDGQLSGVSWPFPIIFTGGIVPGFWRPIVGIDAFDLRQHEIDITPWLGYLLDKQPHTFSINIASVSDNGHGLVSLAGTPSYWLVTGTIFLFQDHAGSVTVGTRPSIRAPAIELSFSSSVTQDSSGQNNTLTYSTQVQRSISITSLITTAKGTFPASWTQRLSYTNTNHLTSFGLVQLTQQTTTGTDIGTGASKDGSSAFTHTYSYPLTVNSSFAISADGSSLSLSGSLTHGKSLATFGNPVFPSGLQNFNTTASSNPTIFSVPGSPPSQSGTLPPDLLPSPNYPAFQGTILNTMQTGSASYFSGPNNSYSFGTTEQYFTFAGLGEAGGSGDVELYSRHVKAVNTSIVLDDQTLLGRRFSVPVGGTEAGPLTAQSVAGGPQQGVRGFLGRGPGSVAQRLSMKRGALWRRG